LLGSALYNPSASVSLIFCCYILTVSGFDLAWFRSLLPSASLFLVFMVLYIYSKKNFVLHPCLYLLMSWAWWDWPLMWLT